MPELAFVDVDGDEGAVTEGLNVDYDGRWSGSVERCVAGIEERLETGEVDAQEAFDELVIRLPELPGIKSARRRG